MSKVTVNKDATPSQELIAKAAQEFSVTDKRGRVIALKKPPVLAQFRLVEALGETSKNEVYMNMALPLIFVTAIDNEPVFPATTKREFEAFIQQLDEDGVEAVGKAVAENFGAVNPDADKQAIKN